MVKIHASCSLEWTCSFSKMVLTRANYCVQKMILVVILMVLVI